MPDCLPKSICHCDFDPSNALVDNNTLVALIDFDLCNLTASILDCALLINPFSSGFEWDTWEGYSSMENPFGFGQPSFALASSEQIRLLSHSEKQHLFDACKLTVLIDCLWFFERGNWKSFYERRKNELLDSLGKEKFTCLVFPGA